MRYDLGNMPDRGQVLYCGWEIHEWTDIGAEIDWLVVTLADGWFVPVEAHGLKLRGQHNVEASHVSWYPLYDTLLEAREATFQAAILEEQETIDRFLKLLHDAREQEARLCGTDTRHSPGPPTANTASGTDCPSET